MNAPNRKGAASAASSKASRTKSEATAAGGDSPGTNTLPADGVPYDSPADDAAEDVQRKAEAVLQPGESMADVLAQPGSCLVVRALTPGGFRRAGRFWPAEPVRVLASDFTPEQLEALTGEALLHVTPLATGLNE